MEGQVTLNLVDILSLIKIHTKYDLSSVIDTDIKRVSTGEIFRLLTAKPFTEIADYKVYILKLIEGES